MKSNNLLSVQRQCRWLSGQKDSQINRVVKVGESREKPAKMWGAKTKVTERYSAVIADVLGVLWSLQSDGKE